MSNFKKQTIIAYTAGTNSVEAVVEPSPRQRGPRYQAKCTITFTNNGGVNVSHHKTEMFDRKDHAAAWAMQVAGEMFEQRVY